MLRWLLLLALTYRTASASSPWWCTGEHDKIDAMPEYATDEERELLAIEQRKAAIEATGKARAAGKGPLVTAKLVEAAMIKARDEAHDRVHLRVNQEALAPPEREALVPVEALLPAGVVADMMQKKEQNRG